MSPFAMSALVAPAAGSLARSDIRMGFLSRADGLTVGDRGGLVVGGTEDARRDVLIGFGFGFVAAAAVATAPEATAPAVGDVPFSRTVVGFVPAEGVSRAGMSVPGDNDARPIFVVFMGGDFAGGIDCARGAFGEVGFDIGIVCVRGAFGDGVFAPPTAEEANSAAAVAVPATAPDPFITIASRFCCFC